jgi:hypothetical protein
MADMADDYDLQSSPDLPAILARVEQRLSWLKMSAHAAGAKAGKPDAIRNMRRAVKVGSREGVSTATLIALAPVLQTTPQWLLTGAGKAQADELLELIPFDKRKPLNVPDVIEAFGIAIHALLDRNRPEAEARILARAVVRALRMPASTATKEERRRLIEMAVALFREHERDES